MSIVERFATPACLPDLDAIPGQREQWHKALSYWLDNSIQRIAPKAHPGPCQFYNPAQFDPGGLAIEHAVTWNAFPKELLRLFGREKALQEADKLWTLARYFSEVAGWPVDKRKNRVLFQHHVRPQTEYCEWRVTPDRRTGKIRAVTFTCEPPEFWFAFFGNRVPGDPPKYDFKGDRGSVLARYRSFVGGRVRLKDMIAPHDIVGADGELYAAKGEYNIFNWWNTTEGIVHLCSPPNFLVGEIEVASATSILRKDKSGRLLVEPEALICCARFGGPNRNTDPTIGAAVNAAARLGAFITLKDPIGLYMDHIDLSGWECRDKKSVADCIHVVRGTAGMIERLVVEVPRNRDLTLSDITIGGEPIQYGGQIAECITVRLIGVANLPTPPLRNDPVECSGCCVFDPKDPHALLRTGTPGVPPPRGLVVAYSGQGVEEVTARGKTMPRHRRPAGRRNPARNALSKE